MAPDLDKTHRYTVTYRTANHWEVLTQRWGSIWPKVLPYCIVNVALAVALRWLKNAHGIDLGMSDKGHRFMGLIVAYLVVTRANQSMSRFNEARGNLSTMYRQCIELIQTMTILSSECTESGAQEWRFQVAYRALLMLRTSMAVLNYHSEKLGGWDLPGFQPDEAMTLRKMVFLKGGANMKWAHGRKRSEQLENMRVPIYMAYKLRTAIHSHADYLPTPLNLTHELKLLSYVDGFMVGFDGIKQFLTTPLPFPLVQMTRTFLFFYLYTIPFALLADPSNAHLVIIFFITYGFMGVENVAMELDDPFGQDPNDFHNRRMAHTIYEDIYVNILDVDGEHAADRLRLKMYAKNSNALPPEAKCWLEHDATLSSVP